MNNNNPIIETDKLKAIFETQETSKILNDLKTFQVNPLQECCKNKILKLEKNVEDICVETAEYHSVWLEERRFRVTGSNAYSLFTYRKNKTPEWKKKSLNYFYPKSINNCYVKHGVECEPLAREAYKKSTSANVLECGLIVSRHNPWLGYSPDGIVFVDDKPTRLIEIKCPYNGKKEKAQVVKSLTWLEKKKKKFTLKKCHSYYCQVQIGMAVLNLPVTDFIIYTPFDDKILKFPVSFDPNYAMDVLTSLKRIYFNNMIHCVCQNEIPNE